MRLRFHNTCVNTAPADVPALYAMIDTAVAVTRRTFLRRVDRGDVRALERMLGYGRDIGLPMAHDPCVSYARSTWRGRRCYFVRWSAIEHYFTPEGHGLTE